MPQSSLDELCRQFGITTDYGPGAAVPDATKRQLLKAIGVDPDHPPPGGEAESGDLMSPEGVACYSPDWLTASPAWGVFCQLYELRSDRSWGIGDFRDLADLARITADAGADFLGINPLHALFLAEPSRRSPFMPSNRRFLNPIYIAMDDLPGEPPADEATLDRLRMADAVDYEAVSSLKLTGLRAVYRESPFSSPGYTAGAFSTFCESGGRSLQRHAIFEVLSQAMVDRGHGAGWLSWPAELRDPENSPVTAFARDHAEDVQFHCWLQWIASIQLAAARQAAFSAGMRIGIYLDLAVGDAPDGSATWSASDLALNGFTVGAPPDVFAQEGQNWHLSAMSPTALARQDLVPFGQLIEAHLRYAGALRIDHAMSLRQLFMIPDGETPAKGTHLRYPFAELLSVLAEASVKHRSIIIGEDLGWVPRGFRAAMQSARLMAYRILYFEHDGGLFRRTAAYPGMALACVSTHDLPTLSGWWQGEDIEHRRRFGLVDADSASEHARYRLAERRALVAALVDGGQLEPGSIDTDAPEMPESVLTAAYRFLAETPCLLVGVRLADLAGPAAATNVPGTIDQYPNWQLRSPTPIQRIPDIQSFRDVTAQLRAARPKEP